MAQVIQIVDKDKTTYHISHNPNNGKLTTTEKINEATIYKETKFDSDFMTDVIKIIKYSYPNAQITRLKTKHI